MPGFRQGFGQDGAIRKDARAAVASVFNILPATLENVVFLVHRYRSMT